MNHDDLLIDSLPMALHAGAKVVPSNGTVAKSLQIAREGCVPPGKASRTSRRADGYRGVYSS
jgi:hypothetical protein